MIALWAALQFFSPAPLAQRDASVLMQGVWVSCPQDDGDYGEKALDFQSRTGAPWFEVHYGPRDEFALFAGNTPEHVPHDDARNLLRPAYHYSDLQTVAGGRTWSFAAVGVSLNAVAMPPSQMDCYAFYVRLERLPRPTWVQR